MPVYCYTTEDGKTVEEVFPMGKAPKKIRLPSGEVAFKDIAAKWQGRRDCDPWPRCPESLGTHPRLARAFERQAAELGVPTKFRADGIPVFNSKKHQDAYMKAKGFDYKR